MLKLKYILMDYRDKVFMSVAENLSFSKAAEELFISQPAVTKHIKELESKLNVTLFNRKSNRIYLTEAGNLTYNHFKVIKQQYEQLEFELGKLNDTYKGILRIGASSTISQYLLPPVLSSFYKKYPEIKLCLYNGNSFEMQQKLINNEIDIVLVENFSSHPDIHYSDFIDDELVVVTGTKSIYAKKKFITVQDFQELPIVLREKGSGTLEVINKMLEKNNIDIEKMNVFLHLGSTETIKSFLTDFDGIALVSEKAIKNELLLKSLKIIKVNNLSFNRKFRIGVRHGAEMQLPKLLMRFLNNYNF